MIGRRRGFTLVEMSVYMFIALLVLSAVYMVFLASRSGYETAESSFELSEEAEIAFRTLQRDLRETSLGSIRSAPGGASMVSARDPDHPEPFPITPAGVPQWQSYVFYCVVPQDDQVGNLVRWTSRGEAGQVLPLATTAAPFPILNPAHRAEVLHSVLLPGKAVRVDRDVVQVVDDPAAPGGFALRFVRTDAQGAETLSLLNPSQQDDAKERSWSKGNTRMVQVDLQVMARNSETGKVGYTEVDLVVTPRN